MQTGDNRQSDIRVRKQEGSGRGSAEHEGVRWQPEAEIDQEIHGSMVKDIAVHLADCGKGEPTEVQTNGSLTALFVGFTRSYER